MSEKIPHENPDYFYSMVRDWAAGRLIWHNGSNRKAEKELFGIVKQFSTKFDAASSEIKTLKNHQVQMISTRPDQ